MVAAALWPAGGGIDKVERMFPAKWIRLADKDMRNVRSYSLKPRRT
jgi:hypothetical protein